MALSVFAERGQNQAKSEVVLNRQPLDGLARPHRPHVQGVRLGLMEQLKDTETQRCQEIGLPRPDEAGCVGKGRPVQDAPAGESQERSCGGLVPRGALDRLEEACGHLLDRDLPNALDMEQDLDVAIPEAGKNLTRSVPEAAWRFGLGWTMPVHVLANLGEAEIDPGVDKSLLDQAVSLSYRRSPVGVPHPAPKRVISRKQLAPGRASLRGVVTCNPAHNPKVLEERVSTRVFA